MAPVNSRIEREDAMTDQERADAITAEIKQKAMEAFGAILMKADPADISDLCAALGRLGARLASERSRDHA